jgi:hypothetical protein
MTLEELIEKHPDLYQEIYSKGYNNGYDQRSSEEYDNSSEDENWSNYLRSLVDEDDYDYNYDHNVYDEETITPLDDSNRYHVYFNNTHDSYNFIMTLIDFHNYEATNRDIQSFYSLYSTWNYGMHVTFNPTHKLCMLDSMIDTTSMFPHLCDYEDISHDQALNIINNKKELI